MKKLLFLVIGLFVAGLAAWAVPRELKEKPVKIEIIQVADVAIAEAATVYSSQSDRLQFDQGASPRLHRPRYEPKMEVPWSDNPLYYKPYIKQSKQLGSWKYRMRVNQNRI